MTRSGKTQKNSSRLSEPSLFPFDDDAIGGEEDSAGLFLQSNDGTFQPVGFGQPSVRSVKFGLGWRDHQRIALGTNAVKYLRTGEYHI